MPTADPARQSLDDLKLERDAIWLYDRLAAVERDERRAVAFRTIAGNERRHAAIWEAALERQGVRVPPADGPRLRVRAIAFLAARLGTRAVADLVRALEGDEEAAYGDQAASPEVVAIAADEREHAEIWRRLDAGAETDGRAPAGRRPSLREIRPASTEDMRAAHEGEPGEDIAAGERWHRAGQSGTLRAVIFGVSDGLVSNTSLVMGIAGAASNHPQFVLLAGIAGLLAGSSSMAAGEYISMQSQRELFERQIALEREELRAMPEEEQRELVAVYRGKGFTRDEAERIAARLFGDPEAALDTLVREELGLDPDELGNPWRAAIGSFVAFAAGAAVPVIPFLFGGGDTIALISIGLSLVAMFAVGVGVSLLTGRSALFSGLRQVLIGSLAAGITFLVGRLIGVGVG